MFPRYASISVPGLMPENAVRTRTSPCRGSGTSHSRTSTDRGATNQTALARTGVAMCPDRILGVLSRQRCQYPSRRAGAGEILPRESGKIGGAHMPTARELTCVTLPTPFGPFETHAFEP